MSVMALSSTEARVKEIGSLFRSRFIVYVGFLLCLQPDFFKTVDLVNGLYRGGQTLLCIACAVRYLQIRECGRSGVWVLLFYLPMYGATLIYGEPIGYAIQKTAICVTACMFVDITARYHGAEILNVLGNCLLALLVVACLTLIPFPNGLDTAMESSENYKLYFLGIKNGLLSWLVLAIVSTLAYHRISPSRGQRNKVSLVILLSVLLALYEQSSTCLVGVALLLALLLFDHMVVRRSRIGLKTVVVWAAIVFVAVVILRVQNHFDLLLQSVLGKSSSFTGRTELWDEATRYISERPLLGYGLREQPLIVSYYGRGFSSHNLVLESLLSGGVAALTVFLLFLRRIHLNLRSSTASPAARLFVIAIAVFLIGTLTESGLYVYRWFVLLSLAYNVAFMVPPDGCKR